MKTEELCRILIVDDEQLIRKGIIHYIDWEQEGFLIVGESSNGQEALELIPSVKPHIIITDIVMPIMDGEELTRVVKECYPHIEIIILSSFSEFDYVRSTFQNGVVDYILKPSLDSSGLLNVLKKAVSRIPLMKAVNDSPDAHPSIEQLMNTMISGYEITWNENETAKFFPFENYYLLGIVVKSSSSLDTVNLETIVKEKLVEKFGLTIGDGVYYSCRPNKQLVVILLNIEKIKIQEVINSTCELAKVETGIGFALTEEFTDILQMGKMYRESLSKLLDYRFFLSEMPLIMKENLPKLLSQYETFNLEWFTEELKRKRFDSAFGYLKEHAALVSQCYTYDISEYKAFFSNIIFNITILLSNMEYDVKKLDTVKYSYFKSIDEVGTAQEAVTLLHSFIEEAKKCLYATQTQQDNVNLKKLVDYMIEHYAESLTLTEMAKQFHLNPSYLSNYFSIHMHEGFSEYLNKIRIEEATKLLKKNSIPISEISEAVGYSDHSYFCKVFKKIKGLSPSQYKRLNR